jgi:UDP-N-acetylmuramyl pentapeptide synthase
VLRSPLWRAPITRAWRKVEQYLLGAAARGYRATFVRDVRVVSVVGSYGKTTTGRVLAAVLATDDPRWRLAHDALKLRPPYSILRLRPGDRFAVTETAVGQPGVMARRARMVRPDVTVVMSVGSEHNPFLPSLEVTRTEKAEMVRVLAPSGHAVLNGDDPNVRWMATQTRARVTTFGFDATNDVRATDVAIDGPDGTDFVLHAGAVTRSVRTRLVGRTMVYPILGALTVALLEGLDIDEAIARVESVAPTPRRLEPVTLSNGAVVLYDHYKAALETVDVALDAVAAIPARRKIVVLGDLTEPPGSVEEVFATYERLGARVAAIADRAVFVNAETDGLRPLYSAAAISAGMAAGAVTSVGSALEAFAALPDDLGSGDLVLVKGANQQRFDRIRLALEGRPVRCNVQACAVWLECPRCPVLEQGWEGDPRYAPGIGI